jgi:hypothetical protein
MLSEGTPAEYLPTYLVTSEGLQVLSDEPGVSNTIDNGDDGQATRQGHEDRVGRLHRHRQALRTQTRT